MSVRALFFSPAGTTAAAFLFAVAAAAFSGAEEAPNALRIWSDVPAQSFDAGWNVPADDVPAGKGWEPEGYPVGNGRIGAMALENPARERVALNEITLWSGGENAAGNCSGYAYGPTAGNDAFGSYQPFADLLVEAAKPDGNDAENFVRFLSLSEGVAGASFSARGVNYEREVFASAPQDVVAVVWRASERGKIGARLALSPHHSARIAARGNRLTLTGTLANGMRFAAALAVVADGGTLRARGGSAVVPVSYVGGGNAMRAAFDRTKLPEISVENADAMVVLVAMRTDFSRGSGEKRRGPDPAREAEATVAAAERFVRAHGAGALREGSVAAHRAFFDRCSVDFGESDPARAALPTALRLKAYAKDPRDPDFEETLFQFGRYLLISSSRGPLPANLQGLWNDKVHAPWASDYHNNINLQEAYWAAETTNLSECHLPLLDFIAGTAPASRAMTQKQFGKSRRGWTTRISQNPWGWGGWTMWNVPVNAWFALHMWEHFLFTQDKEFLRKRAYPMMKEACLFWEDHLKELGENGAGFSTADAGADLAQLAGVPAGTLVPPGGWSHEWGPVEDGVAHDCQLVRGLFGNTAAAAEILGVDAAWAKNLRRKRARIAPDKISKNGYLQEWMIDRPNMVRGHRHTSHLFAVFPGSEISPRRTPELAAAAKKSLDLRGNSGDSRRSWTWPWRAALRARLKDGEKAHEMLAGFAAHNLLPNLLATHPPFQADGNFSYPAAVAEMLMQSHEDGIELLPAPCSAWKSGSVRGLKARGNVTVDFAWENGRVTRCTLFSPQPREVRLTFNGKTETRATTLPPPVENARATAR